MKILTDLSPAWEQERTLLEQRLAQDKIRCVKIRREESHRTAGMLQDDAEAIPFSSTECFVLTDSEETGRQLTRAKIPWAGCGKERWFEGAVLVLESLEGIDGRFLFEWMCRAQGRPAPIAQTERLKIREITKSDTDDLIRIYRQSDPGSSGADSQRSDPAADAACTRPGADVFTEEGLAAYIRTAYRLQGYGLWSVLYEGQVIGCCGFAPCAAGALELQYMTDTAYQRQGFGTEMCRAAIDYAKERLGITDIRVQISPENTASLALAGKLGIR